MYFSKSFTLPLKPSSGRVFISLSCYVFMSQASAAACSGILSNTGKTDICLRSWPTRRLHANISATADRSLGTGYELKRAHSPAQSHQLHQLTSCTRQTRENFPILVKFRAISNSIVLARNLLARKAQKREP